MKYMKNEQTLFTIATIALLGGTVGELVNPYYIGMFVDNLKIGNYD
jgi:membrane protein YqaA with SNARE-associated domain